MKVPPLIQKTWRANTEWGDMAAISKKKGLSIMTVRRAFKKGVCSKKTYDKINEYFIEKNNEPIELSKRIDPNSK